MRTIIRVTACAALAAALLVPVAAFAEEPLASDPVNNTELSLEHWKNSSRAEQRAFLLGFFMAQKAALDWQGKKTVPVGESLAGPWVRGLEQMSFTKICDSIDAYIAKNPDKLREHVLVLLGRLYVLPKLNRTEANEISEHYKTIMKDR